MWRGGLGVPYLLPADFPQRDLNEAGRAADAARDVMEQ